MRSSGRRGGAVLALLLASLGAWATLGVVACAGGPATREAPAKAPARYTPTRAEEAFLDTLERRTFQWFWDLSDAHTGLTPDRAPSLTFASVSATGFALTAYPIGVERGWVSRAAARDRVLATLRFFWTAKQDTAASGTIGYRGFFYHFLELDTGTRFKDVELSTIDTAWFLTGVLFCQSYFDRGDASEATIRSLADSIVARVDWRWAVVRPNLVSHGWDPEHGFLEWDWGGYNESMIVPILALASTTHPVDAAVWRTWLRGCRWGTFEGQAHVGFPPLFGHQWTATWVDLRGVRDSLMDAHGIDWFENSRRATLSQRAYAVRNPKRFRGYGARLWGLTACDGPIDGTLAVDGIQHEFRTYSGRGVSFIDGFDDGTVAPTAAAASIVFAPDVVIPTLVAMREDWGEHAFNRYGFVDALNPTLREARPVPAGRIVPGVGWFDVDQLGIDQGPIVAMIENYRSGLVWRVMRGNPTLVRGMRRAGLHGGWLDSTRVAR